MTRVVSWNIATMHESWRELVEMDADEALLQEVAKKARGGASHAGRETGPRRPHRGAGGLVRVVPADILLSAPSTPLSPGRHGGAAASWTALY